MRKQNILLTLTLIACLTVVLTIWFLVRDKLHPVTFPPVVNAELTVGALHKKRVLTPEELVLVKKWIADNQKGWGPLHKAPPSTGDVVIYFNKNVDLSAYKDRPANERPYEFTMTLWMGISQADWNNKVFYQIVNDRENKVFIKDCNDQQFDPLKKLVDQYDYTRSLYP